ncbi:PASTA domain-containing protein [Kribbella sp. NPDC051718]|uniref:PASTA domain-containing protein n=1 Tax=Kribbella sp. NPDC051718 TaxID=3155168 RepID=UPI003427429E
MRIVWCVPLLLLSVSCGISEQPRPAATVTVTATQPTQPTASQTPTRPPTPPQTAQAAVVPAVVGLNHQLAQDTMQAAGFYYLTEEDASGKGRLLINDRNWVVVSQSPEGGTTASLDSKIVLRSKKIGE